MSKHILQCKRIALIGSGLFAENVLDLIKAVNANVPRYAVVGYYTDKESDSTLTIPCLGNLESLLKQCTAGTFETSIGLVACIDDNGDRKRVVELLREKACGESKMKWAILIHPLSSVSTLASISEGTVIFAGAVIGPHAQVGMHSIINAHTFVDRNCKVGDYVHIASDSHLRGPANVEDLTLMIAASGIKSEMPIDTGEFADIDLIDAKNASSMDTTINVGDSDKEGKDFHTKNQQLSWIARKLVNFKRIEYLLSQSIQRNHFANCGPCVQNFEIALRNLFEINSNKAIVLANNGSAALHAIIGGLEIYHKRKLKWATQAFTFPTSVQANLVGTLIVDVDVDGGLNIDLIEPDYLDGIIVTNTFGHIVDINKYITWAERHNKYLVFDNAATSFTFYQGQNALNYGTTAFVSFHHTKPVGFGEGGAIIIDKIYEAAVRQCINFGYDVPKGNARWLPEGSNYKMSDVQAAFIYAYLDAFPEIVAAHTSLYDTLKLELSKLDLGIRIYPNFSSTTPFTSCFPVLFSQPINETLLRTVADEYRIDIRKYYKPLIAIRAMAPLTHDMYNHIVCFPCHSQMTADHIDKIKNVTHKLHNESFNQE